MKQKEKIKTSDIILIPGGNPDMLYSKLEPYREQLYKNSDKIIIGESARLLYFLIDIF